MITAVTGLVTLALARCDALGEIDMRWPVSVARRCVRWLPALSARQLGGLLTSGVICVGVAVAAVVGQAAVATCLLALLLDRKSVV